MMKYKLNKQNEAVISKFKEILKDLNIEKLFLFGSRARGEFDKDSDWDFYIVTRDTLDIIINDKSTFNSRKNIINTIANEALIEGIQI